MSLPVLVAVLDCFEGCVCGGVRCHAFMCATRFTTLTLASTVRHLYCFLLCVCMGTHLLMLPGFSHESFPVGPRVAAQAHATQVDLRA